MITGLIYRLNLQLLTTEIIKEQKCTYYISIHINLVSRITSLLTIIMALVQVVMPYRA